MVEDPYPEEAAASPGNFSVFESSSITSVKHVGALCDHFRNRHYSVGGRFYVKLHAWISAPAVDRV